MPWQPQLNLLEVQRHRALSLGLILKPSSVKLNHFLRSLLQKRLESANRWFLFGWFLGGGVVVLAQS